MASDEPMAVGVIGGGRLPVQWGLPFAELDVETPYGRPSAPVLRTSLGSHTVYSILRHGEKHAQGYRVNYLANVAALAQAGCRVVISLSLAGSLTDRFRVGGMVLYDDVLDFRKSSASFHLDAGGVHCSMAPMVADPLRRQLDDIAAALALPVGATMVVIEGPRYSTRAESRMYATLGGELICQTIAPECFLVREKGMDWFGFCLITDRDTRDPSAMVTTDLIFRNLRTYEQQYAAAVLNVIRRLRAYHREDDADLHRVPHDTLA